MTKSGANKIEVNTRDQAKSVKWHTEREWRITASNFGTISRMTCRRNILKLCKALMQSQCIVTAPILHGRHYEQLAIERFQELSSLKVKKCGLFILPSLPFLGATPDGVIDEDAIVEVKCPYKGRETEIRPGKFFPFLLYENGNLMLKKTHRYYDQVQGQLHLSGRKVCYFVVYTFKDCQYFKVELDAEYCKLALVPKLELFYGKHFRPYVASSFFA